MENNTRVRFAPSPTGFLHIGGLRTVLFNYLIAKSLNGKLILRIEDTDQKRLVEDAQEKLIDIIKWVGIDFDEGPEIGGEFGPYIQTERLDIYNKYIQKLIAENKAYYCFCTSERLTKMREDLQAQKLPPRYDRHCRDLSKEEIKKRIEAGESYVIRQKMPLSEEIIINDELRGEIKFNTKELDDHVLIKANGIPTYQFASVVDDHEMQISHVVRGEEWIPSFPKNVLLYKAFNWELPKFIHLPLVMNKEGGKLSKRQGDVAVEDFKAKGYLKETLINFNALLGWSPYSKNKDSEETLTIDEIIRLFDYKDISTSSAIFDIEKLDYLNGYYIRQKNIKELTRLCLPFLKENIKLTSKEHKKTTTFIEKAVKLEQERLKKLSDITETTKFLFIDNLEYETDLLIWKKTTLEDARTNLKKISDFFITITDWNSKNIEEQTIKFLKENNYGIGDFLWPTRVALSGQKNSPGQNSYFKIKKPSSILNRQGLESFHLKECDKSRPIILFQCPFFQIAIN